ncbi:MAG: hypothetical protein U1F23_02050 [Lysobacterales bacterium]
MDKPTNGEAKSRFSFITDWQAMTPASNEAIREFWTSESAIPNRQQMDARLPQVVMHALDGDRVAAVCTAVQVTPPVIQQPMYFFRIFIGKAWRSTRLFKLLGLRARDVLEEYASTHGWPCIGILLELENQRFKEKGRMAVWPNTGFTYVGKSGRGLEVRVYYFHGARLKS